VLVGTTPDRDTLASYRQILISEFSSLLFRATPGEERTQIYLNCWALVCENQLVSRSIADSITEDLKMGKLSLYPMLVDFLHPMLTLINAQAFEVISEALCQYSYDETEFESFARLSASIWVIYIRQSSSQVRLIPDIAGKLLRWSCDLYELRSPAFEFIVDVFNFVVCYGTFDSSDLVLQEMLISGLKEQMKKLPKPVLRAVFLNWPPQVFKDSKDPLLLDCANAEREVRKLEQSYSPDRGDSTYVPVFQDSSLFNGYEDDFGPSWF
jgi:hypothetical protein